MTRIDRTAQVYDFIISFTKENNFPPSIREIGKELNISSTETVVYHLKKLENQGKIARNKTKNRAIEITDKRYNFDERNIPLVGKVAAGIPITATENIEDHYTFSSNLFGDQDDLFILTVSGDSMENVGILDGDKIVVHRQETAENGEIVVAMIDDSATVKRFYKEKGHIRLQPENDYMRPIIVDNATILGIVVGLVRNYR